MVGATKNHAQCHSLRVRLEGFCFCFGLFGFNLSVNCNNKLDTLR